MNFIKLIEIILYTTIILMLFVGICLGEYLYRLAIDRKTDKSLFLNAPHNKPTKEYLTLPKDEFKKALQLFLSDESLAYKKNN